jgi:hypothetical protein
MGIFKKILWGIFWTWLGLMVLFGIYCIVWEGGGWLLSTFPHWLTQIILGVGLFCALIITALLLSLGIIKITEIGKEVK